jgi:hypothetical protein
VRHGAPRDCCKRNQTLTERISRCSFSAYDRPSLIFAPEDRHAMSACVVVGSIGPIGSHPPSLCLSA